MSHELEAGRPGETLRLRRRDTLLHPRIMTAGGNAFFVGLHVHAGLPSLFGEKSAGVRQPTPLLLRLKEPVVHLPESRRAPFGYTCNGRCGFGGSGMQRYER